MGIYIKGVEMPTSCLNCRFHKSIYCTLTDICTNTAQGCPLVEIPPHGRLGDLNALSKEVDRICARYDACIIDELTCAKQLVYAFSSLPTIIPAEEGE